MKEKTIDVIGLGSPILDLLVEVEDYFLDELELRKGEMVLTSKERAEGGSRSGESEAR